MRNQLSGKDIQNNWKDRDEALIKVLYLQTLELFPNGLIMEEQLHIFGFLLQASINNEDIGPFFTADIPC